MERRQSSGCGGRADRSAHGTRAESCGLCSQGHGEEREVRVEITWLCSTCCPEMLCANQVQLLPGNIPYNAATQNGLCLTAVPLTVL